MSYIHKSLVDRRITVRSRWFRVALIYGTPPGSHIGYWRTRWNGLDGINFRIGKRVVGPCLTVLIHTMSER